MNLLWACIVSLVPVIQFADCVGFERALLRLQTCYLIGQCYVVDPTAMGSGICMYCPASEGIETACF